jgi:hypothetical protein
MTSTTLPTIIRSSTCGLSGHVTGGGASAMTRSSHRSRRAMAAGRHGGVGRMRQVYVVASSRVGNDQPAVIPPSTTNSAPVM